MHDNWTDRLSEFLDGELTRAESAALEEHLETCAECSATLADLRRVVARAQALEDRPPVADLWPGVAALVGGSQRSTRPWNRRVTFSVPQLIAAGIALVLLTGGSVVLIQRVNAPGSIGRVQAPPTVSPAASPTASPVLTVGSGPASHIPVGYDGAITDLQQVLQKDRGHLDTATVRIIDENLRRIDRAIGEAQHALAADPGNIYLSGHLNQTRMRKLDLLRRAAALASAAS